MLPVHRVGMQGLLYQDSSNKMWQLQGTITLETKFISIYILNYIFLSSNILSISLYIIAWKMRNLEYKQRFWLILSLLIEPWKKSWQNNLKKIWVQYVPSSVKIWVQYVPSSVKIWVQYVPSSVKIGSLLLLRNPRV